MHRHSSPVWKSAVVAATVACLPLAAADTPLPTGAGRPRVLLIGDSIAGGYFPHAKGMAAKRMDLSLAAEKSKVEVIMATPVAVKHLDEWLGDGRWDVIHFNFGLHDLKIIDPADAGTENPHRLPVGKGKPWVGVEQYAENLRVIVQRLKRTGATLVWCTTTPVPTGAAGRVPGSEVAYNAAALEVMQAEGVQVNDLHAFIGTGEQRLANGGRPQDVHYKNGDPGYKSLAREVVRAVDKALQQAEPVAAGGRRR